ncbi:MAG: CheR family methyltransferase [Pseudomonadota bacterium]
MSARDLLQRETGLVLSQLIVDRALSARAARLGIQGEKAYLAQLTRDEFKALIELVVVPESWMFRDPDAFTAATAFVRERLALNPGRTVRILSLPCAGGEEPYSIAMSLRDAGVARGDVAIEAIDLSEVALARARAGLYTRNAFRGASLSFRDRYFTSEGHDYRINQDLRSEVAFSQGNLMALDTATRSGRYDIIFCRNLLIYFDDAGAAEAIARLDKMLTEDGMLFAGYAEVPTFCANGFAPLRVPGAFALRKDRRGAALAAHPLPAERRAYVPAAAPAALRQPLAAVPRAVPSSPRPPSPNPPTAAELLERASRLADQGDYAAARTSCEALLAFDPDSSSAYYLLGMISECENSPAQAEQHWRRCVYLQPDHYEALCHLALLAERAGNSGQAASFKQRAARIYQRRQDSATRKPRP